MKKAGKIRICDWCLLILSIVMLISAVQLEFNPFGDSVWVWLHVFCGMAFMACIFWHLDLHGHMKAIYNHIRMYLWLGGIGLLTLLGGIIATVHWIGPFVHTTIGGIHGKIGFIMLIAVAVHVRKHIGFYKRKKACPKRTG